jgi:rhamnosyltransferase
VDHRIAAAVVVYRPDAELLLGLLRSVASDLAGIFLFLNSPLSADLVELCRAAATPAPLQVLGSGANVGLGQAYNEAARAARAAECDLLMLFDQDSSPSPGIPGRLAAALSEAQRRLGPVAVIGPRPVPPEPGADYEFPLITPHVATSGCTAESQLQEIAFVISSGSLIDLDAFLEIGPFREDFFIDGIDIEWGFRARAHGFRSVMALREAMPHRFGRGLVPIPLLNVRLTRQPPERIFTYARNQIMMMRLPHVPAWWKARAGASLALRLVVFGLHGRQTLAIIRGVCAGLRRRARA